jgi:hypothetical protein
MMTEVVAQNHRELSLAFLREIVQRDRIYPSHGIRSEHDPPCRASQGFRENALNPYENDSYGRFHYQQLMTSPVV